MVVAVALMVPDPDRTIVTRQPVPAHRQLRPGAYRWTINAGPVPPTVTTMCGAAAVTVATTEDGKRIGSAIVTGTAIGTVAITSGTEI